MESTLENTAKKIMLAILLLGNLAVNTSCETDEDNTIAKAQLCLDKTNPAGATACLNMVSGLESTESYAIRCAARFIANGLTTSRVADAMESLKTTTAGQDPAAIMMGTFAFQNNTAADLAYSDCDKSGSSSFIYIAQIARMGTILTVVDPAIAAAIAAGTPISPADIDAAVAATAGDPVAEANLGATAVALAATQCAVPGENTEVCSQISAAIANNPGNNQAIGAAIIAALSN